MNEETLDRTVWRTRFGRIYGPLVRQTTECMNIVNYFMKKERKLCQIKPKCQKGTQSLICGNGARCELREDGPNYYILVLIRMFYNIKFLKI